MSESIQDLGEETNSASLESFGSLGLLGRIERVMLYFAALLLAVMLILVVYAIFVRSVLSQGIVWTDELSGYLLVWSVALAIPELARVGGHVTVDVIVAKTTGARRRMLLIIADAIAMLSSFAMFLFSAVMMARYFNTGALTLDTFPVPNGALLVPLCLSFGLMSLRFGASLYGKIRKP